MQGKAPLSLIEEKIYRYRRKICTHAHKKALHQDTKNDYVQQFAKKVVWYSNLKKKVEACLLQGQIKARSL